MLKFDAHSNLSNLSAFFLNPMNLRLWTVHRDLYWISGRCFEATSQQSSLVFCEIKVEKINAENGERKILQFSWYLQDELVKKIEFSLESFSDKVTKVTVKLSPTMSESRTIKLKQLLSIEFKLLNAYLLNSPQQLSLNEATFLQTYHQELST